VEKGADVAAVEGAKRAEGEADHVQRQETKMSGDRHHHTRKPHQTKPAEDPLALR
jgi:hypothetical protein